MRLHMRRDAKVDANQSLLVDALRAIGCSVQPLHTVGKGCPDLLVGFRGQTLLMEVKDGSKPPSARELTPDQKAWHKAWRGSPVWVVTDVTEAVSAAIKEKA
jgi:hypothetical protein